MKTYAPKSLRGADLRRLMDELFTTPPEVAKFLQVTERSVWRWLSEGSAPFAVLAALWHETPRGRETSHIDVGNDLAVQRGLSRALSDEVARESLRLFRLVQIADTGAANDPLLVGPFSAVHAVTLANVNDQDHNGLFLNPEDHTVRADMQPVTALEVIGQGLG